jgi:hypothetical protein
MKKLIPILIFAVVAAIPIYALATLGVYVGAGPNVTEGLYHMDGNSNDSSGNSNNGTDTSVSYVATSTCQFGTDVAKYNGSTSVTKIASTTFPWSHTAWTISFWFQLPAIGAGAPNGDTFIGQTNASINKGLQIAPNINGANTLDIDLIGASSLVYPWTADQKCHNLIAVGTPSGYSMYLDGKLASSTTASSAASTGSSVIGIGCTEDNGSCRASSFASTTIDELIIATTSWTQQMVSHYYAFAKGRLTPNQQ